MILDLFAKVDSNDVVTAVVALFKNGRRVDAPVVGGEGAGHTLKGAEDNTAKLRGKNAVLLGSGEHWSGQLRRQVGVKDNVVCFGVDCLEAGAMAVRAVGLDGPRGRRTWWGRRGDGSVALGPDGNTAGHGCDVKGHGAGRLEPALAVIKDGRETVTRRGLGTQRAADVLVGRNGMLTRRPVVVVHAIHIRTLVGTTATTSA